MLKKTDPADGNRQGARAIATRRLLALKHTPARYEIQEISLGNSLDFWQTELPNNTKPGSGLSNVTKIALDDFSVNPISHIPERRFFSSSIREDWQRVAGETEKPPFCV